LINPKTNKKLLNTAASPGYDCTKVTVTKEGDNKLIFTPFLKDVQ